MEDGKDLLSTALSNITNKSVIDTSHNRNGAPSSTVPVVKTSLSSPAQIKSDTPETQTLTISKCGPPPVLEEAHSRLEGILLLHTLNVIPLTPELSKIDGTNLFESSGMISDSMAGSSAGCQSMGYNNVMSVAVYMKKSTYGGNFQAYLLGDRTGCPYSGSDNVMGSQDGAKFFESGVAHGWWCVTKNLGPRFSQSYVEASS